ncbi:MAG: hypothetical protein PVG35_09765 [Desulfobacterales bacterium]|jgi:hypothetical protein
MPGSRLSGRVNDHPYSGWDGFYRHRWQKTGTRRAPVVADKTWSEAHSLKNPIHWQNSAKTVAGLLLILILTGCGQTNETGALQPKQTAAQAEFTGVCQPAGTQQQGRRFPYAPDQVLVKFKPEADAKTIAEIRTELKLETIQKFSSPNLFLMRITDSASVETIIQQLSSYDAVQYAEPNYRVKTTE